MFLCVLGKFAHGDLSCPHRGKVMSSTCTTSLLAETFWNGFSYQNHTGPFHDLFPAFFARSAFRETGFPSFFVRGGMTGMTKVPFYEIGDPFEPGFLAMERERERFSMAQRFGSELGKVTDRLVLGSCVPCSASGALLFLRSMGYEKNKEFVTDVPGINLKRDVLWEKIVAQRGIRSGGLRDIPWEALLLAGDTSLPLMAGLLAGLPRSCHVVLGGDLSMLALAAFMTTQKVRCSLEIVAMPSENPEALSQREILAKELQVPYRSFASGVFQGNWGTFRKDDHSDLMGIAGALWYAENLGVSLEQILRRVESLHEAWKMAIKKRIPM